MKLKKNIFTILFFVFFLLICSNVSEAGTQKMKNLNYDVQLNQDGSMDVVETWNITVEDTNTLFKTFQKDSSKYGKITNVKVEEIKDNKEVPFTQIYTQMYHVTKGAYYALDINSSEFEIAWGVSIDSKTTKTYKISYTVTNAVSNYNDCSELYWQFLGTDNGIYVNKATGTIKLPKQVENMDNLRVWAHGPLNGEITRVANDTVKFEIDNLQTQTMLEVRIVTSENIFTTNTNVKNTNKLESIINEETIWANEANKERTRTRVFYIFICIIILLISIWFLTRTIKYIKELKKAKKIKPTVELDYYRDIPDEKATPADAAFLYYYKSGGVTSNISKIFSATILDLCLKKMLSIDVIQGEKKEESIKITLNKQGNKEELDETEKIIYSQLEKIADNETNETTLKQIQNYIKEHSSKFVNALQKIEEAARKNQVQKQNFNKSLESKSSNYKGLASLYIILLIFVINIVIMNPLVIIPGALLLINGILCAILSTKYSGLTQKGVDEKEQWEGLKKYMLDFSMIKDKEVPELILWEKYLVFATVFGIADKVMKQLKIVYPQLSNEDLIGDYAYMHLIYHNNFNMINIMNSSIDTSYSSAYRAVYSSSSSGGGFGGGFSGGGGGRRWRRPEWAEDKN